MTVHTSHRRTARANAVAFARALHPVRTDYDTLAAEYWDLAATLNGRAAESARRAAQCYENAHRASAQAERDEYANLARSNARNITGRTR